MQDADLGGGEADAERVVHQHAHARDLVAQRVVEALDRRASVRSTGSPNLRTCASAASRRARDLGVERRAARRLRRLGDSSTPRLVGSAIARAIAVQVGYWGSTSTLNAARAVARRRATASHRGADRAIAARAVAAP